MIIEFYKSFLCPRCHMAEKHLRKITESCPGAEIVSVEITRNLKKTRDNGISMIPAIRIGDRSISGVFLTREKIETFLSENLSM